jgi:predicted nucleic acid-binding protein
VIVLDASAVLELLLATPAGRAVADRIAPRAETLHAPHLLDLEVAQVLRRYAARGVLGAARAGEALEDLADLDVARYGHELLLPRIWELRHDATACDAAYLALAELLGAPLLTRDARLASLRAARARVELI